jgi:two-component system cell cycle response regulator
MISETEIHNAKILIVDDQESNVLLLQRVLEVANYTSVSFTTDPYKVYELHRKNHYDLILLDLKMAGMDGFQVLEALKEIEADGYLSVLVVTANPDCKLRALQSGAKDFVSKPFDMAEVLARVHNLLEVRLLHQQARNYAKTQEFMALHDPLTGLANRRLLVGECRRQLSTQKGMAALWPLYIWIWMDSGRSTIPWATMSATCCLSWLLRAWWPLYGRRIPWRALGVTNL